jgi:hypothetical protein
MRSRKDAPSSWFQNEGGPVVQLRRATSGLSFRPVPLFRGPSQLEILVILAFWGSRALRRTLAQINRRTNGEYGRLPSWRLKPVPLLFTI